MLRDSSLHIALAPAPHELSGEMSFRLGVVIEQQSPCRVCFPFCFVC